jgi:hypothetical protein
MVEEAPSPLKAQILLIFGGLGDRVEYDVMRRELQELLKLDKDGTTKALKEVAALCKDAMGNRHWQLKADYVRR